VDTDLDVIGFRPLVFYRRLDVMALDSSA